MQGKEEDEGILSYVEDDDAAMCVSARRTFAVIFLECYRFYLHLKQNVGAFRSPPRPFGIKNKKIIHYPQLIVNDNISFPLIYF